MSEEAGTLRPSLVAGMAGMLARNLARGADAVRLFELGTVFTGSPAAVRERPGLALGATGGTGPSSLHRSREALLFEVKGTVEALLAVFSKDIRFEMGTEAAPLPAWIEPGRGARVLVDGQSVGVFGELSASEAAARKLRQSCAFAEIDAAYLLALPLRQPALRELSRFQAVDRDFSFIFPDSLIWGTIEARVRTVAPPELQVVQPLEIFRDAKGKAIPRGSYSLLIHLEFQSPDRTLTEEELNGWGEAITGTLTELGGTQRAPDQP